MITIMIRLFVYKSSVIQTKKLEKVETKTHIEIYAQLIIFTHF